MPDYTGNRRQDSHTNVLENPHVGLIFLIPGMNETLRINGRAALVRDHELLEDLPTGGTRPPRLALCVDVQEVFLHCAKAFLRGGVWDPQTWIAVAGAAVRCRDLPRPPRHARPDRRPDAGRARREHPRADVVRRRPQAVASPPVSRAGVSSSAVAKKPPTTSSS